MDRFGVGSYTWTAGPETDQALVRVQANDGVQPQDASDGWFLIANDGSDYYVDDGSNADDQYTPGAVGDNTPTWGSLKASFR